MIDDQQYSDLKALRGVPGWLAVRAYIEGQIGLLQGNLERQHFDGLEQVAQVQGKLQAYRDVLGYPEISTRLYEKRKQEE